MSRFAITTELPAIDNEGKPVIINGNPVYETNYYCGLKRQKTTGIVFTEWDTDITFARRFLTETLAENHKLTVLAQDTNLVVKPI